MKILHLSDLHIGKRVNEFSLFDDQRYIFRQILDVIDSEKIECVIIAGDIYDKSAPSAEAVSLFDEWLTFLFERNLKIFIISGNHDSAERIGFGSKLLDKSGVYLSPVYSGDIAPVTLSDEYGEIVFTMLPFIKPANVRAAFPDEEITSYTDAVRTALSKCDIDTSKRNILITHQFVTGASKGGSEEVTVGGTDNVDVNVFDAFDYVALGHIHNAQSVSRETVRYCGTPLKYSFSEVNSLKTATVLNVAEKGNIEISAVPLAPLHDMREVRGSFEDMVKSPASEDYMRVILTDEQDIPDALSRLRGVFKNLMILEYDNSRTRSYSHISGMEITDDMSPQDMFAELFSRQYGKEISDTQREILCEVLKTFEEGE